MLLYHNVVLSVSVSIRSPPPLGGWSPALLISSAEGWCSWATAFFIIIIKLYVCMYICIYIYIYIYMHTHIHSIHMLYDTLLSLLSLLVSSVLLLLSLLSPHPSAVSRRPTRPWCPWTWWTCSRRLFRAAGAHFKIITRCSCWTSLCCIMWYCII